MHSESFGPARIWSAGGALLTAAGPLNTDEGRALAGFYRDALARPDIENNAGAWRYLAARAAELDAALIAAEQWRRAARGRIDSHRSALGNHEAAL
jgi:hypothetical protein